MAEHDKKKRLVFSILQFLKQSVKDGTIKEEDVEGVEVAVQCIGEAFGVDVDDPVQATQYATKRSLLQLFTLASQAEVTLASKQVPSLSGSQQPEANSESTSTTSNAQPPLTEEQLAKAEQLKSQGNIKLSEKDHAEAIRLYGEAITINSSNAIYYANRAAAYSQIGKHDEAIADATKSTQIDPSYSKGYSRLGHAYLSIGKFQDAAEAYEKGLSLDPENKVMKEGLASAEHQATEMRNRSSDGSSMHGAPGGGGLGGLGGLANLFGGGGGGGPGGGGAGGPGGFDMSSLLNNPALMNAAGSMMRSGAFNDLMNNPKLRQMAQDMMQGGAPPSAEELMDNPELREMAQKYAGQFNEGGAPGDPTSGAPPGQSP